MANPAVNVNVLAYDVNPRGVELCRKKHVGQYGAADDGNRRFTADQLRCDERMNLVDCLKIKESAEETAAALNEKIRHATVNEMFEKLHEPPPIRQVGAARYSAFRPFMKSLLPRSATPKIAASESIVGGLFVRKGR